MMVPVQSSFHTTWASLFEMELKPNSLDWNELELEDMKRTVVQEYQQELLRIWAKQDHNIYIR